MKKFCAAIMLGTLLGASGQALAGECTISGQGLVSAYTMAVQNGYRFFNNSKVAERGSTRRLLGRFYTQPSPGRIGFKTGLKGRELRAVFFGGRLQNSWKLKDVRYAGTPTATRKSLKGGSDSTIVLSWATWRDTSGNLRVPRKFDVYITSLTFKHPRKSCGRDIVTQQIALRDMFGG